MPNTIGTIVEPDGEPVTIDTGRIAGLESNSSGDNGSQGESRRTEPEIIAGYESTEPATVAIGANIGGDRRKRGRPRKSTANIASNSAPQTPNSLVDLTTILVNVHNVAAALLDIKELALDKSEAEVMSDATKEVLKYYPVGLDPKKVAIANMIIVFGGIYSTRIMAYRTRMQLEASKPQKVVTPIDKRASTPASNMVQPKNGSPVPYAPSDVFGPAETFGDANFNA